MKPLKDTGTWVRKQVEDNPNQWRAERDIWAVGLLLASLVTWLDWHPPEGLTLAVAYLIIRAIQLLRRRAGK